MQLKMLQNDTKPYCKVISKIFHPGCCTVRYHTISLILSNEQTPWQQ